jgi:hypothetical protein
MVVYETMCEKCNIDGPTICNSGRISLKSISDHARHLEWRWPGPINLGALHSLYGYKRNRYEETNFWTPPSPSFWLRTITTDVFRAGGATGTTRLHTTVRIKMKSIQNARRVNFHLKFPSEQNGIRQKYEARRFLFKFSVKSARRAVSFRKRAVAQKKRLSQTKNSVGDGSLCGRLRLRKETSARHAFPPTIIIIIGSS